MKKDKYFIIQDRIINLTRYYKLNELIINIYSQTLMTKKDSDTIMSCIDKINDIYRSYNEKKSND